MFGRYLESFLKNEVKMGQTKIVPTDLDSPRRELSVRGLGFVVAIPFFGELIFLLRYWGSNPAVIYS